MIIPVVQSIWFLCIVDRINETDTAECGSRDGTDKKTEDTSTKGGGASIWEGPAKVTDEKSVYVNCKICLCVPFKNIHLFTLYEGQNPNTFVLLYVKCMITYDKGFHSCTNWGGVGDHLSI